MMRDRVTIPTLEHHLPQLPLVQPRYPRELTKCNILYLDEHGDPVNRITKRLMYECSPSTTRRQLYTASEIPWLLVVLQMTPSLDRSFQ